MFDQDQASSRNWSPFTISVGGNFFCVRLDKKDLHKIYLTKKQLWDYPKWSHSVNIKSWGLVRHCSQVWWLSAGTMWVNTMNGPANGPISMGLNAWFWQPGGGGTGTWYWYILARVPRSPTVALVTIGRGCGWWWSHWGWMVLGRGTSTPLHPGVTNCPRSWSRQLQLGTVVPACLVQIVLLCQDFQSLLVIDCVILFRMDAAVTAPAAACSAGWNQSN